MRPSGVRGSIILESLQLAGLGLLQEVLLLLLVGASECNQDASQFIDYRWLTEDLKPLSVEPEVIPTR